MTLTILSSCFCAGVIALNGHIWPGAPIALALVIALVAGSQSRA